MVGGGGEEFTLRIAAKHADIWNFWGPVEVMEHKLDVLQKHCQTYDRDYDDITKSWFARCIIRETEAEVDALLDAVPRFHPDTIGDTEFALVGTPEQVEAQLQPFLSLGITEIVLEFVDFPQTDGLELFAETVLNNTA